MIYREKCVYYKTFINNNLKNSAHLWKNLKRYVSFKTKKDHILPPSLRDAEKLNSYFLDVPGRQVASVSDITYFQSHCNFTNKFNISTVDSDTVLRTIKSLKSNAIGCDEISLDMLIMSLPCTLNVITNLINKSIETNSFPSIWKKAIIRPIPKNDNPLELKDLRPISILPYMSIILEKIVHGQLSQYLEANNILPEKQSGFRKNHSTVTALIGVVDDILNAQDKGEGTILVLLDYSRAFDTINIPLLLSKLHYFALFPSSIEWFSNYLKNRTQVVETMDEDGTVVHSRPRLLNRGVPQGPILGPLLFILYCADLEKHVSTVSIHTYADDIQVYISFKADDTSSAVDKLNYDLGNIYAWSETNGLVLNPNKTKYLV